MNDPGARAPLAQALLRPRTIALVGISDNPDKTTGRPLLYLRQAGFKGTIYNINPGRETVQGEQAYPSLSALPEVPDHAFILTNTEAAVAAVEECGRLGVAVATVLATGFSESGPRGVEREARLLAIARRHGVRILGPSSLGVIKLDQNLVLTANAACAEPGLPEGGVFCASHSGSLIGALTSRGRAQGVGFNGLVSVGSEVDLSIGEICEATLDDPGVTGYLLFLESMRHAAALRRFALAAAERGKPVVAFKLGRSELAAELAVSHTGALAGEDAVADTFLKECGIARVDTFEGLLGALPLLQRLPFVAPGEKPSVGVVTTTGGGAAMAVDQMGIRDVSVVGPSEETLARLAAAGVQVSAGRIVDLTMAGTRYDVMKAALDVMQSAPEFDLILAAVGSSARSRPDLAVKPVIDSVDGATPLACFIVPEAPEALQRLTAAGVPNFRTPETCGDVIAAALSRRRPSAALPPAARDGQARDLDEAEAYRLFQRVGIAHAPFVALEIEAPLAALPFDYPVVVKALDARIAHKSDVGGVQLQVRDAEALCQAMLAIRESVQAHTGTRLDRVLVQPMTKGLGEVLVGFRRDADVGPLVMVAAGGVLTELYHDRALRLAPVTLATAREMVAEVKGLKALAGFRGRPEGDLEAVARTVVAVSQLAMLDDLSVIEAEINPIMVMPKGEGVCAVDALVRLI
jgi:acyl-CoA synthetase (NDP forming)